jgi:hypothetical protein
LCIFVLDLDPPISDFGLRLKDFSWNPSFMVELSCDSIPSDLVCLRSPDLEHSISYGCFIYPPNLSSRAQAVWEIHGRIGVLVLAVLSSGYSVRVWQTVRQGVADGPRGAQLLGVCRVRREFFRRFPSICLFWWFWSPEVRRTVCEESANGPPGADGLRVLGGRSIFSGALLEVLEPILDNLPRACGRSAWSLRTVHPLHADGPPRPLQTA